MSTAADALKAKCQRNGNVSRAAFQTLTQPGLSDPKLAELGYTLAQDIDDQQTYKLTITVGGWPIVPVTFTRIGTMMRVSQNGNVKVTEFSYDKVTELNEQIKERYPDAQWPDTYQPEIPWDGRPMYSNDPREAG